MLWGGEVSLSLKNRDSGALSTPGEMSHTLIPRSLEQEVVGPRGILIHVGVVHTGVGEGQTGQC